MKHVFKASIPCEGDFGNVIYYETCSKQVIPCERDFVNVIYYETCVQSK